MFGRVSLYAPLAVVVEIRTAERQGTRRVFRLSASIADGGLVLERPVPFDIGQPVTVSFTLPGNFPLSSPAEQSTLPAPTSLSLPARVTLGDDDGEGEQGGSELLFIDPPREARHAIVHYVAHRLGLPGAASAS